VRPEVRHLAYFVALAEELNFTRAAARVNVVQQALSAGVAQLEALVGVQLFERTTRRVRMTAAGEDFLPRAR
jgi:DNA-binding transcriptional LysR family regulator